MENYIIKAIWKLRPNSQFVIQNDDYSTIEFLKLEGTKPTKAQVDAAIEEIKAAEVTEAATQAQAKEALLARLGLSADEAKLLIS
jgi:hypothetical protein